MVLFVVALLVASALGWFLVNRVADRFGDLAGAFFMACVAVLLTGALAAAGSL